MKNWQKTRNYRRIKGENGEIVANIITVDGVDVPVTDDVYLVYAQVERRERYVAEELEAGRLLSLEKLQEDHVPLESLGVEQEESAEDATLYMEGASEEEAQKARLTIALSELIPEEQALIQSIFFDGVPVREYARRLGVQLRTVQYRRDRLLEKLRKKFF